MNARESERRSGEKQRATAHAKRNGDVDPRDVSQLGFELFVAELNVGQLLQQRPHFALRGGRLGRVRVAFLGHARQRCRLLARERSAAHLGNVPHGARKRRCAFTTDTCTDAWLRPADRTRRDAGGSENNAPTLPRKLVQTSETLRTRSAAVRHANMCTKVLPISAVQAAYAETHSAREH